MATPTNLGFRRNAAQLHALASVEREVRANDSSGGRKYLRDFSHAFRSYESILDSQQLTTMVKAADVILVGDYHALPSAQRFAATLLEQRAQPGDRLVVLGVETIFSCHQPILEEWWRREIDEEELRQRIRFDLDWSYEWPPFYELLVTAREHADAIYGLDCMPRGDLRRAPLRDRHAAGRIAEIEKRHPDAVILVLFGESHLAPGHLPRILQQRLPDRRLLTVLQNVDALYWRAAAESCQQVHAVRVTEDVICVFNSTPLEKYESYRLCLDRWSETEPAPPGLTRAVYNLIDGLVRFLNINCHSPHNGTQPKLLVDLLPEIYCHPSDADLRKLLPALDNPSTRIAVLKCLEERGCIYVAKMNTLFIQEFRLPCAAQEVARFLYHACRGLPENRSLGPEHSVDRGDAIYAKVLETALVAFAARVLCPFGTHLAPTEFECEAESIGFGLGRGLYHAYVRGSVSKTVLRRLFLTQLQEPGAARKTCRQVARKAAVSLRLGSI
jgi:Haem-binding uptake, Tiki superfamily, ChaN